MRQDRLLADGRRLVWRHPLVVRLTHWVNLASLAVLLLSGLQILCAHPAFYWGEASTFAHPFAAIDAVQAANGSSRGVLTLPGGRFDVTGVLGVSRLADGQESVRAFPPWLTLPSSLDLGAGRRWHFFFAWVFALNGALYLGSGLVSGRLVRVLVPTRAQLAGLGRTAWGHLRLKFPHGEAARDYNGLQKLTYLAVVLGLLPLMVATGLSMSPTIDAVVPVLPMAFGGRQSARTIHFLCASALVLFAAVHLAMILLSGPIGEMRAMITGWFPIRPDKAPS
ncbi:cytochrome b/b6 domain-containing protein [Caulobacter sp. KR2-114]|uniref:cytochrome b/b6 domain-containing protein n=1 Tax=Caulobacter sp. KR2-114 TaxID=3400912 RepID=UPI003C129F71